MSPRLSALIQANIIMLIWSASWVLIKIGLTDIPALTFAGLRYTLAFFCLLLVMTRAPKARQAIRTLTRPQWVNLIVLGVIGYAVAQGAQFVALAYLPSATLSLILNFAVVVVILFGMVWLSEKPTLWQIVGISLFLVGVAIYFAPVDLPDAQIIGFVVAGLCLLANAVGNVLGRAINRTRDIPTLTVTVVSMGVGAGLMLFAGVLTEPFPDIPPTGWAIIIWLATVHTALTFVMWNNVLTVLTAGESSIIQNLMMIEIAVLAWLFLGETITLKEVIGLGVAFIGIMAAQIDRVLIRRMFNQRLRWLGTRGA